MRGVLTGSVKDMRYNYNLSIDRMEVTLTMIVESKPDFENADYIPGEGVEVCFGGAVPQPMRPLYEKPVAVTEDARSASW